MQYTTSLKNSPHKKWWVLFAMSLGLSMTLIDYTGITIALPTIERSFQAAPFLLQWVINAYLLPFAVFLSLGGYLGDIFQHHRVFCIGLIIFLAASISCALASDLTWLIFSRGVQGLGAAMMAANTAAILLHIFPAEERGKAMGIYMGSSLLFLPLALLLGGLFTQYISWRLIFWINLPLSIVCFFIIYSISEFLTLKNHIRKLDYMGFILFALATTSFVFALMESHTLSVSVFLYLIIFSLFLFILFYFQEKNASASIMDIRMFNDKLFLSATVLITCTASSSVLFIFDTLFYQEVLGYNPAITGILFFPSIICVMIGMPMAGQLYDKYGYQLPVYIGLTLFIVGLLLNAMMVFYQNYLYLLPGIACINFGMAFVTSPINTATLVSFSSEKRGVVSGVLNTLRQIANSIGLALLTAIIIGKDRRLLNEFITTHRQTYPSLTTESFESLLPNHITNLANIKPEDFLKLKEIAKLSYTKAYSLGMLSCAFLLMVVALCILILFRKIKSTSNIIKDNLN